MKITVPTVDKKIVAVAIICLAIGFLVGGQVKQNPFAPQKERPVLKFLAKVARLGLWVAAFSDPPPPEENYALHRHTDSDHISHREGW